MQSGLPSFMSLTVGLGLRQFARHSGASALQECPLLYLRWFAS